ncbi:uncharacterized protein C8Q71DRAFT_789458 [Rhodofomes roseus]|uniref:Uncharacterized protein n=1 Tax=Rhodofomes roseus TaxID=34475 RepID=A0ABQ8JZI5_9APHY|nr:uncharacterized protein C8Q71DRAFT_789458 [Rhodofomes roseus]KAH9829681.1 hypothetical protein C8Q71DRAFT_789458 [Rhodofomes roseus]
MIGIGSCISCSMIYLSVSTQDCGGNMGWCFALSAQIIFQQRPPPPDEDEPAPNFSVASTCFQPSSWRLNPLQSISSWRPFIAASIRSFRILKSSLRSCFIIRKRGESPSSGPRASGTFTLCVRLVDSDVRLPFMYNSHRNFISLLSTERTKSQSD